MQADAEKAEQQYNSLVNKQDIKSKMAAIILSDKYDNLLDAPWEELDEKFSHEDQEFMDALKEKWNEYRGGQDEE